jgi:23S rRNA (adenine2503-C2)-methyltransferase
LTVGSSRSCSSPTSAAAIAARISGVGRVAVSERRSITGWTLANSKRYSDAADRAMPWPSVRPNGRIDTILCNSAAAFRAAGIRPPSGYRRRMDLELLAQTLTARGEPAYRARQVWAWAARGAASYEEMTDVPANLRAVLAEHVPFSTLDVVTQAESRDGTVKALFRTHDGHPVEAVLMRYRDGRRSICLSSQSGCPLTCTFCATGQMRFGRNLTAGEILDQALHFRRLDDVDHAVFMGMGEPMLNVDAVLEAARRLPDVGITNRRTTVSTVGWLPGLRRFVDEVAEPIRLAISLHAPEDALRSQLMPVNERYPLREVLAECRRYYELRHRKVFVEYVMLAGVNDRVEQARSLGELLDPKVFKVNLIPYNPTGMYTGSSTKAIDAFKDVLMHARIPTTVRLTRGRDIAAACGQLAANR